MSKKQNYKPNSLKVNLSRILIGLDINLRKESTKIEMPEELTAEFQKLIDFLVSACEIEIEKDAKYYRARINPLNVERPYPKHQMGPPPAPLSGNGRLAPAGSEVLYLASEKDTAISEVRPFRDAIISIAEFIIRERLSAIDFTNVPPTLDEEGEVVNWDAINMVQLSQKYFSAPAHSSDEKAYRYTQYIIAALRDCGYEAFVYQSAQGTKGKNLVLFDHYLAECDDVTAVKVTHVEYKHQDHVPSSELSFPKTGKLEKISPLM